MVSMLNLVVYGFGKANNSFVDVNPKKNQVSQDNAQ